MEIDPDPTVCGLPVISGVDLETAENLGKGTFGYVFKMSLGEDKSLIALKAFPKKTDTNDILSECDLLYQYWKKHGTGMGRLPALCTASEQMVAGPTGIAVHQLMIQMELAKGTLLDVLKKGVQWSPAQALNCATDLLEALQKLRELKIVHRDIALGNIFVYKGEDFTGIVRMMFRLGDFGAATTYERINAEFNMGICPYATTTAPYEDPYLFTKSYCIKTCCPGVSISEHKEQRSKFKINRNTLRSVAAYTRNDLWSVAVVILVIALGNDQEAFTLRCNLEKTLLKRNQFSISEWIESKFDAYSESVKLLKPLVKNMLVLDIHKRISLCAALRFCRLRLSGKEN